MHVGFGSRLSTTLITPVKSTVTITWRGVSSISLLESDSCLLERIKSDGFGANTVAVTVHYETDKQIPSRKHEQLIKKI